MPTKKNAEGLFWQLLDEAERKILSEAFSEYGGAAPDVLGIPRKTFYKKCRKLKIKVNGPGVRPPPGKPSPRALPLPKAKSLYSWAVSPASAPSAPSGADSPKAATPFWLTHEAKPES